MIKRLSLMKQQKQQIFFIRKLLDQTKEFMMSLRISTYVLLRNYNHNITSFKSIACFNHLHSSSLPNLSATHQLHTPAAEEAVQLSKVLGSQYPAEKIFSDIDKDTLSETDLIMHLKALRMQVLFKGLDASHFRDHPKFEKLCSAFQKQCYQIQPQLLISGLRSLLEVGVPPTSKYVVSAEEAVIKNIFQFSAFNLIGCLHYHHKFMETDLQKKVVSVLVTELQKRLNEIATPAEVMMLIRIFHLFDAEHKKKADHKVTELAPILDFQDITKIICTLAEISNRNISILNVMSFYLLKKNERLDFKGTIDLFYALKKLNFFDPKLFAAFFNDLASEIPAIKKPALISGLLAICGHSRWKHPGILDACALWIKNNFEICRTREIVAYILAVASVNYASFETKGTLNLILPQLTLENLKSPDLLLDIAWSLSILDCIPREMLLQVLSPQFYKPLLSQSESQTVNSFTLKLLNLKGILKMKHPECVFRYNLFLEPIKLQESSAIENNKKHVVKVLSNFVPMNKCLSVNQVGDSGILIDAEFIMDQNLKPLPLKDYGIRSKAMTSKPLPKGSKRIALLVMSQKDFTMNSPSLTGVNALGARLLHDDGYTVVHISYNDFSKFKTEVEKAKYLLKKIKESDKTS